MISPLIVALASARVQRIATERISFSDSNPWNLVGRISAYSRIPDEMPALLPSGWRDGVMLLAIVFVLSSFLDNIAGAIIGDRRPSRIRQQSSHGLCRRDCCCIQCRRHGQRSWRYNNYDDAQVSIKQ